MLILYYMTMEKNTQELIPNLVIQPALIFGEERVTKTLGQEAQKPIIKSFLDVVGTIVRVHKQSHTARYDKNIIEPDGNVIHLMYNPNTIMWMGDRVLDKSISYIEGYESGDIKYPRRSLFYRNCIYIDSLVIADHSNAMIYRSIINPSNDDLIRTAQIPATHNEVESAIDRLTQAMLYNSSNTLQ